jgi:hypothetical protein
VGREDAEDNDLAASSYERSIGDGETVVRRNWHESIEDENDMGTIDGYSPSPSAPNIVPRNAITSFVGTLLIDEYNREKGTMKMPTWGEKHGVEDVGNLCRKHAPGYNLKKTTTTTLSKNQNLSSAPAVIKKRVHKQKKAISYLDNDTQAN